MSTNDQAAVEETNDATLTDTDLHKLKYPEDGVEPPKEEDEPTEGEEGDGSEDGGGSETAENSESEAEESEEKSEVPEEFVKKFPHIKGETPEEYAKALEEAYSNSTSEALRLKKIADTVKQSLPAVGDNDGEESQANPPVQSKDPASAWVNSQIDREITRAWNEFRVDYPQLENEENYEQFTNTVATFSRVALDQGRMEEPGKLYKDAALSLGWQPQTVPTDKEKLGMAVKSNASSSKAPSSSAKSTVTSKVTDAHVKAHRHLTGSVKSDAEIRKELESFVN